MIARPKAPALQTNGAAGDAFAILISFQETLADFFAFRADD